MLFLRLVKRDVNDVKKKRDYNINNIDKPSTHRSKPEYLF